MFKLVLKKDKMIAERLNVHSNMSDDQAYTKPSHSQNSLFKHFQGYLGVFRNIDAYSATLTGVQQGGEWRPRLPFLKIEESVLIFEKKALIVSSFGLNFPFKI